MDIIGQNGNEGLHYEEEQKQDNKKKIDQLILEQQKIKRNGGSSKKVEQALGDIKKKIKSKNIICVAPDVGGVERTRALGRNLNVGLAIIDKRRPKPGQSQVMNVIGDVKGKTCIINDDIIDSGGTIINAAKALKQRGAKDVYVYITHGVLSGDAVKAIKNSPIKKLVITDTINNENKVRSAKNIEILSISNLMGEAIRRISNSTSVSFLFK